MGGNCFSTPTSAMASNSASSGPVDSFLLPPADAAQHSGTLLFLHGLGDSGHGWAPVMQIIRQPHLKYICPHAPAQPVTLNMGMVMPSWFDIRALDASASEDEAGIKAAAAKVHDWLRAEEANGIPSHRIVLGGFSQGGGLALYAALTYDKPLAGVVGLSTWLPLHAQIAARVADGSIPNKTTPILQGHGDADPLVLPAIGQLTASYIAAFNPNHSFKSYPAMGHSSCDQEISDLKAFLQQVLPPK